jgi:tetratricopeptide (TPR) repeat protein
LDILIQPQVGICINNNRLAEPALAGRKHELAELQGFVNLAKEGTGSTILVSGEAGSGKTRLVKEFLKKIKDNATILSGWCLSNTAIPYFPFIEAFDSYITNTNQTQTSADQNLQLKHWLTRQQGDSDNQNFPQAWKDQTYALITRELLLLSTQKPLVVFIDDIHWADSASLSLLQYLSRAITCERILLIATYRNEELNSQLDASPQPFTEILRVLRREDRYYEIKLPSLSLREVGEVAKSMLRGNVSPKLIEELTIESSGNPLFVIESLKFLAEQKRLVQENDCWVTTNEQFGLPEKVKDVILRRLNSLTIEARDVLDAGSVIGDKFDAQLIGSVLNQSVVKVLSILNSISKTNSLVVCDGDWFRFDHPKTREVLYEEITLPLKKEYHLRVAETLEGRLGKDENSFGDLAYHFVNSTDTPKAIKYSVEAGKEALSRFSNAEAIKHFSYVLNALEESGNVDKRATALEGLGDAYHANMMFQEAINTYKQLAEIDSPTKVRALRKAMESAFFKNAHDQQQALLKEAEECDTSDHLEKAKILMNKARAASRQSNMPLAIEYFELGLKLAEEAYSEWDVAWILVGLGSTRVWMGQQEKALAELLRASKIFENLGDTRWLIEAYNATGNTMTGHLGLRREGIDFLRKASQVDEEAKVNDYLRLAQLNASWGRALGIEGDLQGALSISLKALSYAEKTDSGWGKGVVYANLTMFYSALGDTNKTEEYYNKLTSLPSDVQRNAYVGTPIAKAAYLASKNEWDEANAVFETVFSGLRLVSALGVEANARITYAEFLKKQDKIEKANQQKQIAENIFNTISERFERLNVFVNLMVPTKLSAGDDIEMRIDIVNASKKPITNITITNLFPNGFKISAISPGANLKNQAIEADNHVLEPFSVKAIKLSTQAPKPGEYLINPQVSYKDEAGSPLVSVARPLRILVTSEKIERNATTPMKTPTKHFKSESAARIYDYLFKAYQQDYTRGKIPKERSGWRSLMDIVREAKVSRYGIYGFPNSQGQAIGELQHLGLVDIRVFEGERGRGGKITKTRICPEKIEY